LLRLLRGDLNPTLAVFTGKIGLSGNQAGLLKLTSLFDIDKEKLNKVLQEYRNGEV
jgi:putative sterol carrier protein